MIDKFLDHSSEIEFLFQHLFPRGVFQHTLQLVYCLGYSINCIRYLLNHMKGVNEQALQVVGFFRELLVVLADQIHLLLKFVVVHLRQVACRVLKSTESLGQCCLFIVLTALAYLATAASGAPAAQLSRGFTLACFLLFIFII